MERFLRDLGDTGRVTVGADLEASIENGDAVLEVLREIDAVHRRSLAHDPPELVPEAATWSAEQLHRGALFLVFRDVEAAEIGARLSPRCPVEVSPAVVYSVDLTLQYLPGLIQLARGVAPGDALVSALEHLAADWPLSSVGVSGLSVTSLEHIVDHPSLLQLYVDRIIQRGDTSRVGDPRVDEALRVAWGGHAELAEPIPKTLAEEPSHE